MKGAAIAALLEEADATELSLHRPGNPGLSTESPDFAELLEQLGDGLRGPAGTPPSSAAAAAALPRPQAACTGDGADGGSGAGRGAGLTAAPLRRWLLLPGRSARSGCGSPCLLR